jgi:hypothetical protein
MFGVEERDLVARGLDQARLAIPRQYWCVSASPLKLIVWWLNTLHPQVDFRLCSVMRRVGEVPKQPFETGACQAL